MPVLPPGFAQRGLFDGDESDEFRPERPPGTRATTEHSPPPQAAAAAAAAKRGGEWRREEGGWNHGWR